MMIEVDDSRLGSLHPSPGPERNADGLHSRGDFDSIHFNAEHLGIYTLNYDVALGF